MPEPVDFLDGDFTRLLAVVQQSDLQELEVREGDITVRVHRSGDVLLTQPAALPADEAAALGSPLLPITSPLVGTFYRAAAPGAEPLVSEGSWVEEGAVVGIVEALQLLTEITSPFTGSVVSALAADGEPVEYGQTLFELRVDG